MDYRILINNIDYTNYLSLPFNVNKKNDSTLLVAAVNLINTDKSDKFFQTDEVELHIDSDIYYLIVASDSISVVKDVYTTNGKKYNHGLQLIDRAKLLDFYNLPSMAISMHDSSYVLFNKDLLDEPTTTNIPTNVSSLSALYPDWKNDEYFPDNNGMEAVVFKSTNIVIAPDIKESPLVISNSNIKKLYTSTEISKTNDSITFTTDKRPMLKYSTRWHTNEKILGIFDNHKYGWQSITATTYLYKLKINGTYSNGTNNAIAYSNEFPISDISISVPIKNGIFPANVKSGKFKISIEFDPVVSNVVKNIHPFIAYFKQTPMNTPSETEMSNALNLLFNTLKSSSNAYESKVEWPEIEVVDTETPDVKRLNYNCVDACNKIFSQVHSIDANDTVNSPKFSLDTTKSSYTILYNTMMPEISFNKNTLSEILKTIGKLINGIPRLTKDNKVYFDILTDVIDNPEHNDDPNILYATNSSLENYANTMVSDVSNLIPLETEKSYSYWPAKGTWGKYLSADAGAIMMPDNAAIKIENCINGGIYKIINFNVRMYSRITLIEYCILYREMIEM